jgi:hypothetical protein
MSSNYPPGVSGNESHITGIPDYDPTRPFWVSDNSYGDYEGFMIYFQEGENEVNFGPYKDRESANAFCNIINNQYYYAHNHAFLSDGTCIECGIYEKEYDMYNLKGYEFDIAEAEEYAYNTGVATEDAIVILKRRQDKLKSELNNE